MSLRDKVSSHIYPAFHVIPDRVRVKDCGDVMLPIHADGEVGQKEGKIMWVSVFGISHRAVRQFGDEVSGTNDSLLFCIPCFGCAAMELFPVQTPLSHTVGHSIRWSNKTYGVFRWIQMTLTYLQFITGHQTVIAALSLLHG